MLMSLNHNVRSLCHTRNHKDTQCRPTLLANRRICLPPLLLWISPRIRRLHLKVLQRPCLPPFQVSPRQIRLKCKCHPCKAISMYTPHNTRPNLSNNSHNHSHSNTCITPNLSLRPQLLFSPTPPLMRSATITSRLRKRNQRRRS
jgi:hypothetical protein